MSKVKHRDDKKSSSLDKLVRYGLDHSSDSARIKDLESKFTLLERKVDNLKYQIKYIADMLRKEQSKK